MNMKKSLAVSLLSLCLGFILLAYIIPMINLSYSQTTNNATRGRAKIPPLTNSTLNATKNNATVNTGQSVGHNNTNPNDNITKTKNKFSAKGLISSMVFSTTSPSPPSKTTSNNGSVSSSIANSTNSNSTIATRTKTTTTSLLPYLLGGQWRLNVNNETVANFTANFTMVHTDGTNRHTHQISNFTLTPAANISLNRTGSTFITGKADIGSNGVTKWKAVPIVILIDRSTTIQILLDSTKTDNHFGGQPINGITTTFS
jgi:hypothetical protein